MFGSEFIVVLVILVSYAATRIIGSSAMGKLDDEMKLKVMEAFSRRNNLLMIVTFVIILTYFASIQIWPQYRSTLALAYIVSFGIYLTVKFVTNYLKLKDIGAPREYVRSIVLAWVVFISGCVIVAAFAGSKILT